MDDRIRINGISLTSLLSESPWPTIDASLEPILQPISVSLDIQYNIQAAGQSDDLTHSINYSAVSKLVQKACMPGIGPEDVNAPTAYGLTERILELCLAGISQPMSRFDVELELPKAVLRAKSASLNVARRTDGSLADRHRFCINELPVHTIVGIHPHERKDKQPVVISLELVHAADLDKGFKFNFAELERRISDFVEASAYLTVEALTSEVARECLVWLEDPTSFTVTVSLAKPAALRMADAPEIRITRSLSDFPSLNIEPRRECSTEKMLATLALGANLGDRFQNIELALRLLDDFQTLWTSDPPLGQLEVIDTSFLYETAPMYVISQPAFINCACLIETTLSPQDMLRVCKQIEKTVGRVPSVRFGPRAVDLDIVTFGDQVIDTRTFDVRASVDNLEGQLVVPHPRMVEREFVLRPLRDIIPEWVHPQFHLSIRSLLAKLLLAKPSDEPPMHKVMPFPVSSKLRPLAELKAPATQTYWVLPDPHVTSSLNVTPTRRTYMMATLNVTPDSFSDGAEHDALDTALDYVRRAVAAGADIIDIGGYSTRPGAAYVSPAEEIARVVPAIQTIRHDADTRLRDIPISIDTFRAGVAHAAIEAGANCINDVYAFFGPEYPPSTGLETYFAEMQAVVREAGVPVVMMHSRGDAGSNKDYTHYAAAGQGRAVLEGVRAELGTKVTRATRGRGALRRWQVMVDPGVGFSKSVEGNLEILRNASLLTADTALPPLTSSFSTASASSPYATPRWNPLAGYPLLVGTSRKSFLGTVVSQPLPPVNKVATSERDESSAVEEQEQGPAIRPAKQRDFATAAAVACAVQQGAAAIRVHAVQEMADVVKVAAALWP